MTCGVAYGQLPRRLDKCTRRIFTLCIRGTCISPSWEWWCPNVQYNVLAGSPHTTAQSWPLGGASGRFCATAKLGCIGGSLPVCAGTTLQ